MERTLLDKAAEYDYGWNKIAQIPVFRNKTDNAIWRKFRILCVKKTK